MEYSKIAIYWETEGNNWEERKKRLIARNENRKYIMVVTQAEENKIRQSEPESPE